MIHKAVIPAAGLGTRMLPAAKCVPKELLPILDRPTIQYVVEEAAGAGITDVLLISSPAKRSIEAHFTSNASLNARLARSNKQHLLMSIDSLIQDVRIHAVDQLEQHGLGHAVYQAREHVGDEPFICMLGDAIFTGDFSPARQLIEAHAKLGTSVIGLEVVPRERVNRYGIVGGIEVSPDLLRLETLVEKPNPEDAPSNLAIAARYLLTPRVFDCLSRTVAGRGGEIQLTDAIRAMIEYEPIHGVVLSSRRHDIGNPIDWLRTNLIVAARDPIVWEQVRPLIEELLHDARR